MRGGGGGGGDKSAVNCRRVSKVGHRRRRTTRAAIQGDLHSGRGLKIVSENWPLSQNILEQNFHNFSDVSLVAPTGPCPQFNDDSAPI